MKLCLQIVRIIHNTRLVEIATDYGITQLSGSALALQMPEMARFAL